MRAVLDSSVAIKWVLPEPGTPQAVRLRNEFRRGLHDLLAPDIFPVEVAHALTRAERRGVLQPPLSIRRLNAVLRFPPRFHSYLPLLPRATAISSIARHGVYDCLYVAPAEGEGIPLVTADQRLLNNLGPSFPFLVDLASLP